MISMWDISWSFVFIQSLCTLAFLCYFLFGNKLVHTFLYRVAGLGWCWWRNLNDWAVPFSTVIICVTLDSLFVAYKRFPLFFISLSFTLQYFALELGLCIFDYTVQHLQKQFSIYILPFNIWIYSMDNQVNR